MEPRGVKGVVPRYFIGKFYLNQIHTFQSGTASHGLIVCASYILVARVLMGFSFLLVCLLASIEFPKLASFLPQTGFHFSADTAAGKQLE